MTDKNLPENIDDLWNYQKPEETEKKFREILNEAKDFNGSYYAELLSQLARTQSLQRKFEEAHSILNELDELLSDEMIVPRIRFHLEKGRTFNSDNQKDQASEHFMKALSFSIENKEEFYGIDAAHMLAISDSEESLKWNEKALEIAEKSTVERCQKWKGSLYNNIAWTYHNREEFDKAISFFKKALDYYLSREDKRSIFIARWSLARAYRSINKLDIAFDIQSGLEKRIDNGEANPDGYVYEELAELHLSIKEHSKAKAYFKKAWEILSEDIWLKNDPKEKARLDRMKELSG